MAPTKKPAHRPLRGTEPLSQRLSAFFTEGEREALQQKADEKRWTLATLVREAIEMRYPEVFKRK